MLLSRWHRISAAADCLATIVNNSHRVRCRPRIQSCRRWLANPGVVAQPSGSPNMDYSTSFSFLTLEVNKHRVPRSISTRRELVVERALGALTGNSLRARNTDERDVCRGPADLFKLNPSPPVSTNDKLFLSLGVHLQSVLYPYLSTAMQF